MKHSLSESGKTTLLSVMMIFTGCLAFTIVSAAVDATKPYAVKIADTNGNQINAGIIADVVANYPSLATAISNSYYTNFPTTNATGTYSGTASAYIVPGFVANLVSTAKTHQSVQAWFGYAGTDAGCFPYVSQYRSLRGVKRAVCIGDSLTQGTGSSAWLPSGSTNSGQSNEGPFAGNWVDQLGETYPKWSVIPSINQGHGGQSLHTFIANNYTIDALPYAPVAGEKVYMFLFVGTNDILLSGRTGAQLISDATAYISGAHSAGFYVVLLNLPRINNDNGTGPSGYGTNGAANNNQRLYFNTNFTSCGADLNIDIATSLSDHTAYLDTATGHFNNAGYAALASNINFWIPTP